MAKQQEAEEIPAPVVDPIETQIHESIDRLIFHLQQRRHYLLTVLWDRREEMRAVKLARERMERELFDAYTHLETQMTHNELHFIHQRITTELDAKRAELLTAKPPKELRFLCDTRDIEERIEHLGEMIDQDLNTSPTIPDYAAFQQPVIAVGKRGTSPGEFNNPKGIAINEETNNIFITDSGNKRIQIFSETGDYLNQLTNDSIQSPYGILIHNNQLFLTDISQHALLLFKLPEFNLTKRVGRLGSEDNCFNRPQQLALSPDNRIYVADELNDRIKIMNLSLESVAILSDQSMTRPVDVKFSSNEIFVLSSLDNLCLHVFSIKGVKVKSLISKGWGMQVNWAHFLCLDTNSNILISDCFGHQIKVFSPDGNLLHTIGKYGEQKGELNLPTSVVILSKTKLVCVSDNLNYGLQIFYV